MEWSEMSIADVFCRKRVGTTQILRFICQQRIGAKREVFTSPGDFQGYRFIHLHKVQIGAKIVEISMEFLKIYDTITKLESCMLLFRFSKSAVP